jgi:hypothetical protein
MTQIIFNVLLPFGQTAFAALPVIFALEWRMRRGNARRLAWLPVVWCQSTAWLGLSLHFMWGNQYAEISRQFRAQSVGLPIRSAFEPTMLWHLVGAALLAVALLPLRKAQANRAACGDFWFSPQRPALSLALAAFYFFGMMGTAYLMDGMDSVLAQGRWLTSLVHTKSHAARIALYGLSGVLTLGAGLRMIRRSAGRNATLRDALRSAEWGWLLPKLAVLYTALLFLFFGLTNFLLPESMAESLSLVNRIFCATFVRQWLFGLTFALLSYKGYRTLCVATGAGLDGEEVADFFAPKELNRRTAHARLLDAEIPEAWIRFDDAEDVGEPIGASREGLPLEGVRFGKGAQRISIVAGSHADEPVGPLTARALPRFLERHFPELLERFQFHVVPQINPDGALRNRPWFASPPSFTDYLTHVRREAPGDDIEFGFGDGARPECQAAKDFLRADAPYAAHFSLHGMAFAEGAWFLMDRDWRGEFIPLMDDLTGLCADVGMSLHDIERKGEKGFTRLRPGFATTPTHVAMQRFFHERDDEETAAKFQPSSMEFVRSLGGDPLCMVSEIPLFQIQGETSLADPVYPRFKGDLETAVGQDEEEALHDLMGRYRLNAVALDLQMRLQFAMIIFALLAVDET